MSGSSLLRGAGLVAVVRWAARLAGIWVAAAVLLGAGFAFAHVHVQPDREVGPGAENVRLTFHVPNEKASAHTIAVRVQLPPNLSNVTAEPAIGWTATTSGGAVTWAGGSIGGGDGVDFVIVIGRLPMGVSQLPFVVDQTYDDGEVVSWDEPETEGAPEPEHPVPVLVLTGAGDPPEAGAGGAATTAAIVCASIGLLVLVPAWLVRRRRVTVREEDLAEARGDGLAGQRGGNRSDSQ